MSSAMTDPDFNGLMKFEKLTDRQESPFFAGRVAEIEDIEGACASALSAARAGRLPRGETRLLQGAPGAGKTALLAHLQQKWAEEEDAPAAAELHVDVLDSERTLALKIVEALDRNLPAIAGGDLAAGREAEFRTSRTTDIEGGGGIFSVVSGRVRRSTATEPLDPSLDAIRRLHPPHEWRRPLCLMFDEAQRIGTHQISALEKLHLGTCGIPVVPVLAGLADTQDVLRRHRLSRIYDLGIWNLGPLSAGDAARSVEMFLDGFRIDRAVAGFDWPSELAARSDGWPQHLHTAMQALAHGLLEADGRLADVDAVAVLREARARRENSYWARVSPAMSRARGLVAEVMKSLPEGGLADDNMLDLIDETAEDPSGPRAVRLPEGMTSTGFLDHLIEIGALQSDGRGRLVCPIPSFRDFLVRGYAMAPEPEPSPRRRAAGVL